LPVNDPHIAQPWALFRRANLRQVVHLTANRDEHFPDELLLCLLEDPHIPLRLLEFLGTPRRQLSTLDAVRAAVEYAAAELRLDDLALVTRETRICSVSAVRQPADEDRENVQNEDSKEQNGTKL
jgi:hypothetical protein